MFTIDKPYPFWEGGAEVHAFKIARALAQKGLNIKILCPLEKSWWTKHRLIDGVSLIHVPVPCSINKSFFFKIYNCHLILTLIILWPYFDVMHFFGLRGIKLLLVYARIFHKRYFLKITSVRNWSYIRTLLGTNWDRLSTVPQTFGGFIVPSHELENLLLKDNVPRFYINYIVNGVSMPNQDINRKQYNRRQLSLSSSKTLVLCMGRLHPDKNIETLVSAWETVQKNIDSVHLLILGDGCEKEKLKNLIGKVKARDTVTLYGFVPHEIVNKFLLASDLFVLPSQKEGCSNALLEAMAARLACIAINCKGNQEIITNGINGILIDDSNPAFLAEAIINLIKDGPKRKKIGEQAYLTTQKYFSIDKTVLRYINLYCTILINDA